MTIGFCRNIEISSLVAQMVKKLLAHAGDIDSIPGLGRSLGEGEGYSFQYSGLENSLYSPRGCKQSDMTEQLTLSLFTFLSENTFEINKTSCSFSSKNKTKRNKKWG